MTLFDNVIVPLDGSRLSAHALPAAQLVAGASGAKLTLLSSFPEIPDWQADASRGRRRGSMAAAQHDRVGAYLSGQRLRLVQQGFSSPVDIEAREGPAYEFIVDVANRDPNSLIAMSTRGHGGLSRLLSGSVTSRVLGSVGNPILVVRCNDTDCPVVPQSIDNLIVPLDGSPLAKSALRYAENLASAFQARITLVRCVPDEAYFHAQYDLSLAHGSPAFAYYDGRRMVNDAVGQSCEYLLDTAGPIADRFPATEIDSVTSQENPVETVLDLAHRLENPMVVMATHGRRGMRRFLLGSVADQVIRQSPVPTLLVKQGGQPVEPR